MHKILQHN